MTVDLPGGFLTQPIAHRALHDLDARRPENSPSAIEAAVEGGYGIEIDLQLSQDGVPLVFHDYTLERLTDSDGRISELSAKDALVTHLNGGGPQDHIPTLTQTLAQVAGRVPLLIELKDQSASGGFGTLERETAKALQSYTGPVAVMSFHPGSVAMMAQLAPTVPRGLTTCAFDADTWEADPEVCARLSAIPDVDDVRASFISHHADDLDNPRVHELRNGGLAILCWTIRSPAEEASARQIAHNITFEGYAAAQPG
ncbi:MAG: glycerophosphodiester phosphodiesterase family protein [Pseudomonadota bacterium]